MFATVQNYAHELNWQQGLIHYITKAKKWLNKVNTYKF